jgi:hypothetical protein
MKLTHRRLSSVSLSDPVSDPSNRSIMHMSTLIASDLWLLETSWDGSSIGDIQVFINRACGQNGVRMTVPGTEVDARGRLVEVPAPDDWAWWRGVPKGKVNSYSFVEEDVPAPATVEDVGLPFELPNAQPKAKPDQAGKGSPATAG